MSFLWLSHAAINQLCGASNKRDEIELLIILLLDELYCLLKSGGNGDVLRWGYTWIRWRAMREIDEV